MLAFTFPLSKSLTSYFIAIWIVTFFSQKSNLQNIRLQYLRNKALILSSIFYVLHLIWLINTQNIKSGLFDIQVKMSFLILPFLVVSTVLQEKKNEEKIFLFFISGSFISQLISIFYVLYIKYFTNATISFFYGDISIFLHPSYMSLYVILSIVLSVFLLYKQVGEKIKIVLILNLLFSIVFIFLLSSKSGMISLFLLVLMGVIFAFLKINLNIWLKVIVSILLLLGIAFSLLNNSRIKQALSVFDEIVLSGIEYSPQKYTESNADRLFVWKSAFEMIKENWLLGAGTGDVKDALLEQYKKDKFIDAYEKKLNSHNQYLETFIGLGIIGFLVLIGMFIIPLITAIKESNYILISFLIIVAFNLLFESMFNTQAGVVFIAFFYNLLAKFKPSMTL